MNALHRPSPLKLEAVDLIFRYDKDAVIDRFSFRSAEGEFLSIIGPNGAGKSTLLKILSGILAPESGEVIIDGQPLRKMSRKQTAKKIAVVPQFTHIEFPFTVREIIAMGRTPHLDAMQWESAKDRSIIEEAMIQTDVFPLRNKIFKELSGGERQRVIIARALTQQPDMIFLDEATAHLDMGYQLEFMSFIKRLNQQNNINVLMVTHQINLAARFSEKLILMRNGRLIAQGKPEEVLLPENIKNLFDCSAIINKDPAAGTPYVFPLRSLNETKNEYD